MLIRAFKIHVGKPCNFPSYNVATDNAMSRFDPRKIKGR